MADTTRRLLRGQDETTMANTEIDPSGSNSNIKDGAVAKKDEGPTGKTLGDYSFMQRQLSKKFLKQYNQRMPVLKDYEKFANENVKNFIEQTSPAAAANFAQARQMGDAYTKDFVPATQRYLKDAEEYDTPERRESESARARSDVATAADASRQGALDRLEAYGIDPSQTRGAALDANLRLNTALNQVAAGEEAKRNVEERGRAYRSDALDKGGQLLAGQQASDRTGADLLAGNNSAINNLTGTFTDAYNVNANFLRDQGSAIGNAANYNFQDQQLEAAEKAGEGGGLAGLGQLAGVIGGAAIGSFGGPGGAALGAQIGSQVGGAGGSIAEQNGS